MMLQLAHIYRSFGGVEALSDITIDIPDGEVVGLIGPNGSGKTTLLNVISGLIAANRGSVNFDGRELTTLRPDEVAACSVARTFQTPRVFHRMTVWENLRCAVYAGKPQVRTLRAPEKSQLDHLLAVSGLDTRAGELAKTLTLPEQRRLELIRALLSDPKLLLLDEPAGGMTPSETGEMAHLIKTVAAEGRTCIVIEHKIDMIASLCERICVLNFGKVIADGAAGSVLEDEAVLEAYLGRQD